MGRCWRVRIQRYSVVTYENVTAKFLLWFRMDVCGFLWGFLTNLEHLKCDIFFRDDVRNTLEVRLVLLCSKRKVHVELYAKLKMLEKLGIWKSNYLEFVFFSSLFDEFCGLLE